MADNTITVWGQLVRDPDLRFTQGGRAVCAFTVVTNHRYKQGDDWKEEASFIDVTAWAELGENLAASASKGSRVIVSGRFKTDSWDDKETGQKRNKLGLVADEIGLSCRFGAVIPEQRERTKTDVSKKTMKAEAARQSEPVYGDEEPF